MVEIKDQFDYWVEQLDDSVNQINTIINANPIIIDGLEDVLAGLEIELGKVQEFQPRLTNGEVTYPYDYKVALPKIKIALRSQHKAKSIIDRFQASTSTVQTGVKAEQPPQRKILEIPVPIFRGQYTKYGTSVKAFHLKFDGMSKLKAEQLVHLQQLTAEPPQQIIADLEATDDNLSIALEVLQKQLMMKPSERHLRQKIAKILRPFQF